MANQASPVSKSIAEYYARKRGVPARNVCYVHTSAAEHVPRPVYEQQLAQPVARCLAERKLTESILYIVTTLGVPLGVGGSQGMNGTAASVDSELSMLYFAMRGGKYRLEGPYPNPFFKKLDEKLDRARFPIYLVTRLAGYNFGAVRDLIDRGLAPANQGTVFLDQRDAGETTGDEWLRDAAIRLPQNRVVLEESTAVLYGRKNVIGYGGWGSNDKNRTRRWSGFQFLPGAIVTEFVSSNGRTFERPPERWTFSTWKKEDEGKWFKGSPQSLTADYVEEGATGVSGHVYEPYLRYCPRPDVLFPAYVGKGRNLAESYYLSLPALSWMNIVVGDPLVRLGR
ncbi:MAG: TIGR03790 family protein [Bryobacterales bacterium]|nr:TIGR03790 family protein [Bryobacterales bacterium]